MPVHLNDIVPQTGKTDLKKGITEPIENYTIEKKKKTLGVTDFRVNLFISFWLDVVPRHPVCYIIAWYPWVIQIHG